MSTPTNPTPNQVTQARHPIRATLRTSVAFVIGVAPIAPLIYEAATNHNPEAATGLAATSLAIASGVTRVLAIPQLEAQLRKTRGLRWLAAAPASK